jgi:predicted ATP-dependent endonuclease of OLD family
MKITQITIKNFRSIEQLNFEPKNLTAICGTNSSGKSNVLRAIRLALRSRVDISKLSENVSNWVAGNAHCTIELTFDKPSKNLYSELPTYFVKDKSFKYRMSFNRSGDVRRQIDKTKLQEHDLPAFIDSFMVVYVPAIRDIATDGLKPFRDTLAETLRKQKKSGSLHQINKDLRAAIADKGKAMLDGTKSLAKNWMKVDQLEVDTKSIAVESLLTETGIRVKLGKTDFELAKLGTGQQSAVVIKLYRGLAIESGKTPIYLFEEPDNHLHPTSISVVSDELNDCIETNDGQVFFTTHSPYLLNQFDLADYLPLTLASGRKTAKRTMKLTRDSKSMRQSLAKFGLRPAEALLSQRVLIVEGPNDANFLRTLIELDRGKSPEYLDISVVPAGGKAMAIELCELLSEIGADWRAILDWDALEDTAQPFLRSGLNQSQKTKIQMAVTSIQDHLYQKSIKQPKFHKQLEAVLNELENPRRTLGFANSEIGKFATKPGRLTASSTTEVKQFISKRQHTSVNSKLESIGLFVWKGALEEVVLPDAKAENEAENYLINVGALLGAPTQANRKKALQKTVKGFAHDPERMAGLVSHLWKKGCLKQKEAVRAIKFALPAK